MNMEQYLTTTKSIADNLTLTRNSISQFALTIQILSGLDTKYTQIVTLPTDKESVPEIELKKHLLTFESRLE